MPQGAVRNHEVPAFFINEGAKGVEVTPRAFIEGVEQMTPDATYEDINFVLYIHEMTSIGEFQYFIEYIQPNIPPSSSPKPEAINLSSERSSPIPSSVERLSIALKNALSLYDRPNTPSA